MKIKLDENLPLALAERLRKLGHDVDTVPQEGLSGRDDATIWPATQAARRFFITQDLDFSDVRKYLPGTHMGLLLIRLNEPGRLALTEKVAMLFESEPVDTWQQSFVVVTDHKVRVRRPPS
jgi:predicted nuclease of predicted toxin-antitoxin system